MPVTVERAGHAVNINETTRKIPQSIAAKQVQEPVFVYSETCSFISSPHFAKQVIRITWVKLETEVAENQVWLHTPSRTSPHGVARLWE